MHATRGNQGTEVEEDLEVEASEAVEEEAEAAHGLIQEEKDAGHVAKWGIWPETALYKIRTQHD